MEENKSYGKLFNSIELSSEEHLDGILQTMNKESALFILIQAIRFGHNNGIYTMAESEVLSKSIRVLSKKEE